MRTILTLLFLVCGCSPYYPPTCLENPSVHGQIHRKPLVISISGEPRRDGVEGNLLTHPCLSSFMPHLSKGVKTWNAFGAGVIQAWDEDVPDDAIIVSINIGLADNPRAVGLYNGQEIFIKEEVICQEGKWETFGHIVVAHEVGHALTLLHLPDSEVGVMSPSFSNVCGLTENDARHWEKTFGIN